jgi:hypothetical protein
MCARRTPLRNQSDILSLLRDNVILVSFFVVNASSIRPCHPVYFVAFPANTREHHVFPNLELGLNLYAAMFPLFEQIPFDAREPLLQHYGLRTTWIDLVDNVWVALWFACYNALAIKRTPRYLHFEQRSPDYDPDPYSYILVIRVDNTTASPSEPGLLRGLSTEFVDLRIACPSIFLRPHAQHGVLFRMRGAGPGPTRPADYSPQVCGRIRIDLRDALAWLGTGKMLGSHALFPPPFYDGGYEILLNCPFDDNLTIGAIQHVGT